MTDAIVARSNLISAALRLYAVTGQPVRVQVKALAELERAAREFGKAQKEASGE